MESRPFTSRYQVHQMLQFFSINNANLIEVLWPKSNRYLMLWTASPEKVFRRFRRTIFECCRDSQSIIDVYNEGFFTHPHLIETLVRVIIRRG